MKSVLHVIQSRKLVLEMANATEISYMNII